MDGHGITQIRLNGWPRHHLHPIEWMAMEVARGIREAGNETLPGRGFQPDEHTTLVKKELLPTCFQPDENLTNTPRSVSSKGH